MPQFPYLTACFNEALRLEPPLGMGTVRINRDDTVICGHRVYKGAWLNVFPPPPAFPFPNAHLPKQMGGLCVFAAAGRPCRPLMLDRLAPWSQPQNAGELLIKVRFKARSSPTPPAQMSQQAYQVDPRHWEDPRVFRPERLLPPGATSSPGWTPFGEVCRRLAWS